VTSTLPLSNHTQAFRPSLGRRVLLSWPLPRVVVMVIAMAGAAALLYGPTAAWFHDRDQAAVISGYAQNALTQTPAQIQDELSAARAYNSTLSGAGLSDPYSNSLAAGMGTPGVAQYENSLNLGPGGMMGLVSIPEIGVNLPIYHGTSAATLDKGVGHLYGSALPVGGAGTHAVLTGHSGVAGHPLFTKLNRLTLGDTFTITVSNQSLTYRVDQIRTVLPTQTDSLNAVAGKDYVTLVTCTPIGVNTHRLLVRGVRVPTPSSSTARQALTDARTAGFPWWAVMALGCLITAAVITAPLSEPARTSTPKDRP